MESTTPLLLETLSAEQRTAVENHIDERAKEMFEKMKV